MFQNYDKDNIGITYRKQSIRVDGREEEEVTRPPKQKEKELKKEELSVFLGWQVGRRKGLKILRSALQFDFHMTKH